MREKTVTKSEPAFDMPEVLNAVFLVDSGGRITAVNDAVEKITGKKKEDVLGLELSLVLPGVCGAGQGKLEWHSRRYSLEVLPLTDGSVYVLFDLAGIDALSGQLRENHKLYAELEAIIQSSYDGIVIVDGSGTLLYVNKSYENIVGMSVQQYIGQNMFDLEQKGVVSKSVSLLAIKQKRAVTLYQKVESGKEILVTGSPIMDDSGRVLRVITNARDITELITLKNQVEKNKSLSERYAAELKELRARQMELGEIVAQSPLMKITIEQVLKVAGFKSNVLITGETGTGKEVVAKLIHRLSEYQNGPFIQINCGAIPDTLLESELFGYEKGAFTGASSSGKIGLLEMASHGTVLLDEVSELPLHLQVKLLRVIQEQEIYRVGGTKPTKLDVRILAASNRDLLELVQKGLFREDLYYRLNVVTINTYPLRERREDIIPLAMFFLGNYNSKYSLSKRLSPKTTELLERYSWPGNVRELENLIERLVVLSEDDLITDDYLPKNIAEAVNNDGTAYTIAINRVVPLEEITEQAEIALLKLALSQYSSIRKAAESLGVKHSTILRKMKKYGLDV